MGSTTNTICTSANERRKQRKSYRNSPSRMKPWWGLGGADSSRPCPELAVAVDDLSGGASFEELDEPLDHVSALGF